MGPNPFIGVLYHWVGGFASATNFIPFRGIKRWSWEIYWLIQGFAAWIVAPVVLASIFVPNVIGILHAGPTSSILCSLLWGSLWGIGGLTFGLAMHETSGQIILAGVVLCLVAVAVNGAAGLSKEREITPEEKVEAGESDFSFGKGIAVAIFAGIMSSFFAFGLAAGAPIGKIAKARLLADHRLDLWQNLPVLIVVLWGGFVTNFIWSVILIVKNRSFRQFAGEAGHNPMRAGHVSGETLVEFDPRDSGMKARIAPRTLVANYLFAGLAGVIWYFQFFFYSMGQTKMGKYDFSSWTLHMASIIIFATLWGLALKEWRGTSRRTKLLVASGLFLLVSSTVVVGYGNFLKASQPVAVQAETSAAR